MATISTLKVSTRLALDFGLVTSVAVGIAVYGAMSMHRLSGDVGELASDRMVKVARFTSMMDSFNAIGRSARNIVLADDANFREVDSRKIAELRRANSAILVELDSTFVPPRPRELL